MGTFVYRAVREPGVVVSGEVDGDDARAASSSLLSKGYHVLDIEDINARGANRLRFRFGFWRGMRRRDLVRFTRDLATLLHAGLSLSQVLSRLRTRAGSSSSWGGLAGALQARLEDGQTLSEAMSAYPEVFDLMYVNLVRSGEETGGLPEVLARLATLGEQRMELQSRVKMALVYPCAMLAVGFVTVVLLVTLVVPMFVKVFQESGQTLPLPTRVLVVISDYVSAWWWAILPGAGVAIFLLIRYFTSPSGKALMSRALIRLPLFGGVFRKTEIASFGRTLGILLGNGIPIIQALQVTSTTLKNIVYGEAILQMGPPIRDGASLSKTFEKHPLFPPVVADMISVGEESGMLSEKLLQLADEYEREVERELKVVMTLLEPLMILLVGVVVGFIVMAIILPVFALGDTLQQ